MATALKEGVQDLLELCRSAAPRNRSAAFRSRHRRHRGEAGGCGERGVRRATFCENRARLRACERNHVEHVGTMCSASCRALRAQHAPATQHVARKGFGYVVALARKFQHVGRGPLHKNMRLRYPKIDYPIS